VVLIDTPFNVPFIDIVNGNIKYLLGMTWSVARHFNLAKAAGNPSKPSSKNDHAGIDAPLVDEIGQLSVGDAATAVDVPSPRYDPEQGLQQASLILRALPRLLAFARVPDISNVCD
jgi:hypothetical protein